MKLLKLLLEISEDLKKWFDGSIVTTTGKVGGPPLKVYHGTADDFEEFEHTEKSSLKGFFFTENPEVASGIALSKGIEHAKDKAEPFAQHGSNVRPVYLKIKNPCTDMTSMLGDAFERIQAQGYDGIISQYRGGRQFIVFDKSQIRSIYG